MLERTALADVPADIVSSQITHPERPHGKAEFFDSLVDLRWRTSFIEQHARLPAVLLDHAVADKAITNARYDAGFLDLLANLHDRGQHVLGSVCTTNNLKQLHHVGGAEEVHADNVLRTFCEVGDLVDIECRRIRSQNRTWFHDGVELAEDDLLDVHIFEYRLDHEVAVAEVGIVKRCRQERHALVVLGLGELAFLDLGFVVLAHRGDAAIERLLLRLQHHDWNPGVEEVHRDTTAHRAGSDHRHLLDGTHWGVLRHIRNLAGGPFSEECVTQRFALRGLHQFDEGLALKRQAGIDLLFDRRLNRIDAA